MKPTLLVAATERWYPTARLAIAFANAGCRVEAVCPSHHPISRTHAADRIHTYNGLLPVRSIARAIHATNPDLVIPADDLATRHLHELHRLERVRGKDSSVCKLIERSLGSSEGFDTVQARSAFLQLAQQEGILAPRTEVVANASDLLNWITRMGFPVVLKADGTSGGDGVRVVKTLEETERAFRKLQAPPLFARALKHALVDGDLTLLTPSLRRRRPVVNVQAFVTGHEATSTVACWNGTVLASLHFEVLQKVSAAGHATVVRLIEHPEMSNAAVKIVRRLKLSGLYGLDFMLEAGTHSAYLIEINPRSTQVGHLALGPERDLPAALYSAITGKTVEPATPVTANDTIALFPQEWKRDPESPFLLSAYHDVPWGEPGLVNACVNRLRGRSAQDLLRHPLSSQTISPSRVSVAGKPQAGSWIGD